MPHDNIPLLVAHRGYMLNYPENTWRSLQAALQTGACWVEFDIQLCADSEFVMLHDDNFKRTSGTDQVAFETNSYDIQLSVHEPARLGERYTPTPVATLTDTLQRLAEYPHARAMVELKQESINYWGLEKVMQHLLPLLQKHQSQCCLISFNDAALHWCREHSTLDIGWVLHHYNARHLETAKQLQPEFLICDYQKVPPHDRLWDGAWQWMLYDIMDSDAALEWGQRGADLIETADIG
ncbi:hypothetical protein MNBD_GAMMA13-1983, partial [hydrothermal vent metagenome]